MAFYGTYTFRLRHLFAHGEMRRPNRSRRLVHFRPVVAGSLLMRTQALLAIVFLFQGCSRDLGLTRNINEGHGASALVQAGAGGVCRCLAKRHCTVPVPMRALFTLISTELLFVKF
jgi:hypothetical protein